MPLYSQAVDYYSPNTSLLSQRNTHHAARCRITLLLIVTLAFPVETFAQSGQPIVPDEAECAGVPQRSLVALFTTPEPGASPEASPAATPASVAPADDATQAALESVTRSVIACFNAGDYWTLITFVSDGYLLHSFGPAGPMDPLAEELAPFVAAVRGCGGTARSSRGPGTTGSPLFR